MPDGHTELTTPPGRRPASDATTGSRERYSPGLAVPSEPIPPDRNQRRLVLATGLVLTVAIGVLVFRILTAGLGIDPTLQRLGPGEGPGPAAPSPAVDSSAVPGGSDGGPTPGIDLPGEG